MQHQPGQLLGGRYRLDDRIALGGMGEVWRATDTVLGRAVAVKTMRADRVGDPQFQRRFRHEAEAMAALHHPGIADVYDFGQEPDADAYLVMAHVAGEPLDRRIAEQGRLPWAETMSIVAQVGRALAAVHGAGIVHRDVKPGNLIMRPDGNVVLVDFGVARSHRSDALTGAREVVGTAHYIAPEQVSKGAIGPAADLYALGAVAYHCLSGHPPFFGDTPVAIAMQHLRDEPPPLPEDVPSPVRALVMTALAKEPAARFPSAAAMAAAAEQAGGAEPIDEQIETVRLAPVPPVPGSPVGGPGDGSPRRQLLIAVVTALLVLLGAGTVLAFADPFDWFPAAPLPSTSQTPAPAASPSPPQSGRPVNGGTGESSEPPPSSSTTSRSPAPASSTTTTPSSKPPTTPSSRPPTTSPTEEETSTPPDSPAASQP
ncbi:serine/threonine-protein kinase [Actinoplanes sp. NPDC024001]|uniref:serine/threonine-protein kinase n=1 Tax=Actinoplanes sp. NPDC024001 TaxID=3154598 RepID=UPI0033D27A4E